MGDSEKNKVIYISAETPSRIIIKLQQLGYEIILMMEKNRLCYEYRELLRDYLESPEEIDLYKASLMGKEFIRKGIGPEDIIEMHYKSIQKILEEISLTDEKGTVLKSFRVILEVMIAYGMAYKHYKDMITDESGRK